MFHLFSCATLHLAPVILEKPLQEFTFAVVEVDEAEPDVTLLHLTCFLSDQFLDLFPHAHLVVVFAIFHGLRFASNLDISLDHPSLVIIQSLAERYHAFTTNFVRESLVEFQLLKTKLGNFLPVVVLVNQVAHRVQISRDVN